ncbi:MAG: hypothetical protein [Caudoviricetes sp.]|nr:MAG: hypothetical protein [Caudoviricetes sp.]
MIDAKKLAKKLCKLNSDEKVEFVCYLDCSKHSIGILKLDNDGIYQIEEELVSFYNIKHFFPDRVVELGYELGAGVKYLNHNQTETLVEYLYKFKN